MSNPPNQGQPFGKTILWAGVVLLLSYAPDIFKQIFGLFFVVKDENQTSNAFINLNNCCYFCLYLTGAALIDLIFLEKSNKIISNYKNILLGTYLFNAAIVTFKKMGNEEVAENPLVFIGALIVASVFATLATKYHMLRVVSNPQASSDPK